MKTNWTRALGLSAGLLLATPWAHADTHAAAASSGSLPVSATVTASDCWIRQLPAPAPSGGFLRVFNAGEQAVALRGASSPDYGLVMLHETTESGGMSRMSMVHEITVPPKGERDFRPGSYHLMLEQPRAGLKVGDHVQVDFVLDNGEGVSVTCEVMSPRAMPGSSGMPGGTMDHGHG